MWNKNEVSALGLAKRCKRFVKNRYTTAQYERTSWSDLPADIRKDVMWKAHVMFVQDMLKEHLLGKLNNSMCTIKRRRFPYPVICDKITVYRRARITDTKVLVLTMMFEQEYWEGEYGIAHKEEFVEVIDDSYVYLRLMMSYGDPVAIQLCGTVERWWMIGTGLPFHYSKEDVLVQDPSCIYSKRGFHWTWARLSHNQGLQKL